MKSTRDALTLWVKHFFDFYSSRSHSAWQQGQKFQWHWTLFPHSETICAFLSPKKLRHSKQIHQQLPLNLPPLLTKQAQHRVHYFLFFSFLFPPLSLSLSVHCRRLEHFLASSCKFFHQIFVSFISTIHTVKIYAHRNALWLISSKFKVRTNQEQQKKNQPGRQKEW